jgi:hypothetical protein
VARPDQYTTTVGLAFFQGQFVGKWPEMMAGAMAAAMDAAGVERLVDGGRGDPLRREIARWQAALPGRVAAASRDEPPSQGRWRIHGLDLPDPVLRRVYHDNAADLIRF